MWPNLQEAADLVTFSEEILKKNFIENFTFCETLNTREPHYHVTML